jgi:putative transcriptional regulator
MSSPPNQRKSGPGSSRSGEQKKMNSKDMVLVEHNPGDPPLETDTDWDAVNAMTEEQIHAAALSDPDAQPIPLGTDEELAKIGLTRIVNTKRLRERLGVTQEEFAARYRIPVGTLRDWEQQRKFPDAPARAYLLVIDKDPGAVARLLGESAA